MAKIRPLLAVSAILLAILCPVRAGAQTVTKPSVPGITNFSKLETTIACAGATTPEAVPALKEMGYKSIINLRLATEPGANVEGEAAAAKAAGINYVHIPFNSAKPDPAVADAFVTAVTAPENNPAFVHCASANRAAAMWMIKRMVVDKWDVDKAGTEAASLGLTNAALKAFVIEYATTRTK
jgi:uncharacterized protein (TIGR01244 family)